METTTAPVIEATATEAPKEEKDPVVLPAIKDALHTTGVVVADFNLRKVGRGFKALGRKLPKVRIERPASEPAAADNG